MRPRPHLLAVLYSFANAGSERVGADVAEGLCTRGWHVEVCALEGGDGPVRQRLEASGIPCHGLDLGRRSRVGRRWTMLRFLRARRPDVLHVQHFSMLARCQVAARLAGIGRVVVTEHTDAYLHQDPVAIAMVRRLASSAHRVTVIHDGLRRTLVEHLGIAADRIEVIPNGVNRRLFRPLPVDARLRAELGAGRDDLLIGCVARLHPDKDHATLFHALARLPALDWRLVLVGEGEEREALTRLARGLGLLGRIHFLGERDDMPRLMPQLDLCVLPSRTEGLPMVLLEAMACGVPCVATAVGGIPALLADDHGIVVEPGQPQALAAAITRLLQTPAQREHLAKRGLARIAQDYDLAGTIDAYARVLMPCNADRSEMTANA